MRQVKNCVHLIMVAPFLKLNFKCTTVNIIKKIKGVNAGYNSKLVDRSPFNKAKKLRCIPQPGQSMLNSFLLGQVSMWCSIHSVTEFQPIAAIVEKMFTIDLSIFKTFANVEKVYSLFLILQPTI